MYIYIYILTEDLTENICSIILIHAVCMEFNLTLGVSTDLYTSSNAAKNDKLRALTYCIIKSKVSVRI